MLHLTHAFPAARLRPVSPLLGLVALALSCNSSPRATVAPSIKKAPVFEGSAPTTGAPTVRVEAQGQLGPGTGTVLVGLAPPTGAKLTLDAPIAIKGSGGIGLTFPRQLRGNLESFELPLRLPIEVEDGATGPAELELSYYWCTEGQNAACRREKTHLAVQLDLSGDAPGGEAHFEYRPRIEAPEG